MTEDGRALNWATLRSALMEEGEGITEADLDAYLLALTGGDASSIPLQKVFDARTFAEQLLGFEDFATNM